MSLARSFIVFYSSFEMFSIPMARILSLAPPFPEVQHPESRAGVGPSCDDTAWSLTSAVSPSPGVPAPAEAVRQSG